MQNTVKSENTSYKLPKKRKVSAMRRAIMKVESGDHKDIEREKWLLENRDDICRAASKIKIHSCFSPDEYGFIRTCITDERFSGEREETLSVLRGFTEKFGIGEKKLDEMRDVFILAIFERVFDSLSESLSGIEKACTAFRKFETLNFNKLSHLFSPVEKDLRLDPAGLYPKLSRESQKTVYDELRSEARKHAEKPEKYSSFLLEKARKENKSIVSFIHFETKNHGYFPVFGILLFFLCAYFFVSIKSVLLTFLIFPPLLFFTKRMTDFAFSVAVPPKPLLSLKTDKVDESKKTLVCISAIAFSPDDVKPVFSKLERYLVNNRSDGDELYFGAVFDLKQSDKKEEISDKDIISEIEKEVSYFNLKYGAFFGFIRKRTFSDTEKCFMGRERKRGAIEDFCLFTSGESVDSGFAFFGKKDQISNAKYLIALDEDTELNIGQAKRLIGIISYPGYKPELKETENGFVVSKGYGIIQPSVNPSLMEKITTRYGKLFSNGSGENLYSFAGFDTFQTLFSKGIYCGKGIVDIPTFLKVTKGKFKRETVLSHDMPEGAFCGCAIATNEHFSDAFPKNSAQEYKRMHRWIRGDIQNFVLFSKLGAIYRFILIENALRYTVPLFETLLIFISLFYGEKISLICSFSVLLFHFQPLVFHVLALFLAGNVRHFTRRFATKMRNTVLNSFYLCFVSVSDILFEALYFSDAIIRALFRMTVSKKHLLQWQVYSKTNNSSLKMFIIPSAVAAVLFFFSGTFMTLLYCILWLINPLICAFLAKEYDDRIKVLPKTRERLTGYANKTFNYFNDFLTEETNFLPPDNVQFEPVEKIAMRTSPTNIGFALLSFVCAHDLGFISTEKFLFLCEKTLLSVERLEKYKGHLFNWYDIRNLSVIGEHFISTADSGNFVACLAVLSEKLAERDEYSERREELKEKVDKLIMDTDFSVLYDYSESLMRVGIIPGKTPDQYHYDMYMSEARIASFIAVAMGQIPVIHWKNLARPILSYKGRVGAGSWSGTAFEYFLPTVFIPVPNDSFEDESLDYAFYCQKNFAEYISFGKKIFGTGESGYNSLDENENYRYRAFGVPYLSVQSGLWQKSVISPYSVFLMLERDPEAILSVLGILEESGMTARYGFFESMDFNSRFSGDRNIVYSVMAHHAGMSIASVTNFLTAGKIRERFISYANFGFKMELLAERFPIEGRITEIKDKKLPELPKQFPQKKKINPDFQEKYAVLADKECGFAVSGNGKTVFYSGDDLVFGSVFAEDFNITVKTSVGDFSLLKGKDHKRKVTFAKDRAEFYFVRKKVTVKISFFLLFGKKTLLCRTEIGGYRGKAEIIMSICPAMCGKKSYNAHREYQYLSLEATSVGNTVSVRKRSEKLDHKYLVMKFTSVPFVNICGREYDYPVRDIPVTDGRITLGFFAESKGNLRIGSLISYSANEDGCETEKILDGELKPNEYLIRRSESLIRSFEEGQYGEDEKRIENEMLGKIFSPDSAYFSEKIFGNSKNLLWKNGISGDYPIITFNYRASDDNESLESLLRVSKKLLLCGVKFDLAVLIGNEIGYFAPVHEKMLELCEKVKCEFLLNKHYGIHFVKCDSRLDRDGIEEISKYVFNSASGIVKLPFYGKKEIERGVLNSDDTLKKITVADSSVIIERDKRGISEPMHNVCAVRGAGFILSDVSLGYTWYRNSSLSQVTSRNSEERLTVFGKNYSADPAMNSDKVIFRRSVNIFSGNIAGNNYTLEVFPEKSTFSKKFILKFENEPPFGEKAVFSFLPGGDGNTLVKKSKAGFSFTSAVKNELETGGFFALKDTPFEIFQKDGRIEVCFPLKKENEFAIGGYSSKTHLEYSFANVFAGSAFVSVQAAEDLYDELFFDSDTEKGLIRYQTLVSRIVARSGPFQPGGAWGFRDQLQDVTAFLDIAPELARVHLIRCAAHQFPEGDVLHWWHPAKTESRNCDIGIRSGCSDDYMWLVYSAARYVEETGDRSVLDVKVPFLSGKSLDGKSEMYGEFPVSSSAPFSEHLESAANLFLRRGLGKHSLPFILRNDWNDGMNTLDGESVWLGAFGALALAKGVSNGFFSETDPIESRIADISKGISKSFNGKFYPRVFSSDGKVFGNDPSLMSECSIDLITQAFTAFLYLESDIAKTAISQNDIADSLVFAGNALTDEKNGIVKLFAKPFVNTVPSPGYIQKYCAGIRENGGQYTHAAVWFALACFKMGETFGFEELISTAKKVYRLIDPFSKNTNEKLKVYKREPYVVSGDVYFAKNAKGRGGWSWYTGAAGWYLELREKIEKYLK